MRILVTGGAGFIGSHVAGALVEAGHDVVIVDDLSSGKRENVPEGAHLVVADIRSPEAAAAVLREKPEAVFHLAAQMDVRRSVAEPGFDADVNVRGMLNVLEACVKAGTRRFVFSSTGGAIYGEQDVFPAPESHPRRPVSPYGCSKASGEIYLDYYRQAYGLGTVALRYANVYGPRQDPHGEAGVVAIFCGRLLKDEDCTVFGDGGQTRDYVFVGDVVRANLAALASDHTGALNVGTGVETDVNRLYALLAEAASSERPAVHAPERPGEQRRSVIDPSLAGEILGWKPEVTLADGLARTFRWFAERAGR